MGAAAAGRRKAAARAQKPRAANPTCRNRSCENAGREQTEKAERTEQNEVWHRLRLFGERYRRKATAVIELAAPAGAAVAEEQPVLGGGIVSRALDGGKADPGQAMGDVTG